MSDIVIKAIMSPTPVIRPSNSPGLQGPRGWEVQVEYSVDGESWHTTPTSNDYYVRFSTDEGTTWGTAWYIRGEQGEQGATGETGATGATIASVAIVGTDIVFTKSDASTVTLTGAVTTLKGDAGADGTDGATGASIISAAFSGSDIVFTKDDANTVTLADAVTTLKGDTGATGETGATGDSAPEVVLNYSIDGATLWHETYTEGDLYVRVSTDGESTWSGAMKFIGDDGDAGADGTDGATILSDAVDPTTEGKDGDFYLNTTSWDVFKKISGEWSLQGNIKGASGEGSGDVVGPEGATAGNLATFSGTSGKIIQDSGSKVADFEPVISTKGTAFNKDFGTAAGDVCQGNDPRLSDARTPTSHGNDKHSATYITSSDVTYENLNGNGDVGTGSSQVAQGDHNHDSEYSAIAHDHDEDYADIEHDHDEDYADISHNHNEDYSPIDHDHEGTYLESFDVIDDTTPQLGGNLDVNGKTFTQTASATYEFGTDNKQVDFNSNNAHFTLVNNTTGTTIDWRKGNKQTVAPTTDPTYTFTAPGGACSLILKITQHSSAVTITWPAAVTWLGATPDFATDSANYIVSFFYDGTTYWGSVGEEV